LFQDYTNLLPVPLHILEELCERTVLVGIESQPQVAPQLIEHVCDILRQLLLQGIRALVTQIVNSWAKVLFHHVKEFLVPVSLWDFRSLPSTLVFEERQKPAPVRF
jgi:hypothetical protein